VPGAVQRTELGVGIKPDPGVVADDICECGHIVELHYHQPDFSLGACCHRGCTCNKFVSRHRPGSRPGAQAGKTTAGANLHAETQEQPKILSAERIKKIKQGAPIFAEVCDSHEALRHEYDWLCKQRAEEFAQSAMELSKLRERLEDAQAVNDSLAKQRDLAQAQASAERLARIPTRERLKAAEAVVEAAKAYDDSREGRSQKRTDIAYFDLVKACCEHDRIKAAQEGGK
jgi:hypothetical protein